MRGCSSRNHQPNESFENSLFHGSGRHFPGGPDEIAEVYAYFGDKSSALDWLERDYEDRHSGVFYIGTDPWLKPLANEPRFRALLKKIGYAN